MGTSWQNRPVQVLILVSLLILGASEFAAAACYNPQAGASSEDHNAIQTRFRSAIVRPPASTGLGQAP